MTISLFLAALGSASPPACLHPPIAAPQAQFVIQVSVDGLAGLHLQTLLAATPPTELPNFRRLIDEGASTLNARCDPDDTYTGPNHATMVTGRPVLQPAGQPADVHHGYTHFLDPPPGETLWSMGNASLAYIQGVFDVVHDHGMSTALYTSKPQLRIFEQSWNAANGAPDVVGTDNGPDKIDVYLETWGGFPETAQPVHVAYLADMATSHFRYSLVHYRDPDSTGHVYGWESSQYVDALRVVDGFLGDLLALVEGDPVLNGQTALIVSTDHGGNGTGHYVPSDPKSYTIPFFVWGPDVDANADLYALNTATRLDPGTGQPDYNAPVQPVRSGEAANLALALLGLPPVSGSTINDSMNLIPHLAPAVTVFGCGANPSGSMTVVSGTAAVGTTLVLGLDNPLGTQGAGTTVPYLAISLGAQPGQPCGLALPGFGMASPFAPGELIVSVAPNDLHMPLLQGPVWMGAGSPVAFSLPLPANPMLLGSIVYAQGVLIDPAHLPGSVAVGLTEGARLAIGL